MAEVADDRVAVAPPVARRGATALVVAGGSVGTAARYLLEVSVPSGLLPIGTAIANVSGAFLLGLVVAVLAAHVDDPSRRQRLRLLLGTGVLGGYTTYSALSVDIATLSLDGEAAVAAGYGVASLLLGGLACWLGLCAGRIGAGR